MALAVDSEMPTNVGAFATDASSLSYSFTNTAGTLLLIGVVVGGDAGNSGIASVTYDGEDLGAAHVSIFWDGIESVAALYYKLTPAIGSHTVVVTTNIVCLSIISGCISFTGNHATTPLINAQSVVGNGDTPSVTVPGTTAGNIVVDCMGVGSTETANGQTLSWLKNVNNLTQSGNAASQRADGTGGAVVMSYTATSDFWGTCAAEVVAEPAAPDAGMLGFIADPFGSSGF